MDQPLQLARKTIDELYIKYANDPYMFQKTHNYVCFQLPVILDNMQKTHVERQHRNDQLSSEQDSFIQAFLNTNQYFYVPTTDRFFHYDGKQYRVFTEDAILHHVLTSITRERNQLMCRKPQTKVYIMKRIKENHLLKSIPESETIQSVLDSLVPSVFTEKSAAKYFLTVIGDNLLKKAGDQIHFIRPKSKPFLKELSNISQLLLGQNPTMSFKHKYYEHHYAECRLVQIQDTIGADSIWRSIIHTHGLDLLCVAAHYSHRYESGDAFLINNANNDALVDYTMYLRQNTPKTLVLTFIDEYLHILSLDLVAKDERKHTNQSISWTNMQYLWRQFLQVRDLPGVMFQTTLKEILVEQLEGRYQSELDTFIGITSKYFPAVQRFLTFWDSNVELCADPMAEYEIDELAALYKQWCTQSGQGILSLSDARILDLIRFYYPTVEIESDKYIMNIRCKTWDKSLDIQVAIDALVRKPLSLAHPDTIPENTIVTNAVPANKKISVYDAYSWYRKFYEGSKRLVSKTFFERYLHENVGIKDKCIGGL